MWQENFMSNEHFQSARTTVLGLAEAGISPKGHAFLEIQRERWILPDHIPGEMS